MQMLVISVVVIWVGCVGCALSAWRAHGLIAALRRWVATLVLAMLGTLLGGLMVLCQAAQMFSAETLVARVTTRRLTTDTFELRYVPVGARDAAAIQVRLQGDQWAISGGVVKWHPWLTALGLASYHKPLRLSGQFSDVERARRQAPSIHALAPSIDRLWQALYWADPYLPFVDAVYGSSAYAYVEPSRAQEIYVTSSGYLIKRVSSLRSSRPTSR